MTNGYCFGWVKGVTCLLILVGVSLQASAECTFFDLDKDYLAKYAQVDRDMCPTAHVAVPSPGDMEGISRILQSTGVSQDHLLTTFNQVMDYCALTYLEGLSPAERISRGLQISWAALLENRRLGAVSGYLADMNTIWFNAEAKYRRPNPWGYPEPSQAVEHLALDQAADLVKIARKRNKSIFDVLRDFSHLQIGPSDGQTRSVDQVLNQLKAQALN